MTIFSKIAAGEIPSYKCAENDKVYAFLDINPVGKAHTLVIPRKEVDYIFDMEDAMFGSVPALCKEGCPCHKDSFSLQESSADCVGTRSRPRTYPLVAINKEGDVDFHKHIELTAEEQMEIAARIFDAFQKLD